MDDAPVGEREPYQEFQCQACRFWDDFASVLGFCRIRSPQGVGLPGARPWPQTRPTDWCGEYDGRFRALPIKKP